MRGIRKRFGRVVALDGAALDLRSGEVHALLGENGAGKTTLMNILAGMARPDSGDLIIDGSAARFSTPRDAWAAGVGMVHQHFKLVPRLTVLENLALGVRVAAAGMRLPFPEVLAKLRALQDEMALDVPLDSLVEDLPVGVQQRVEILKLLIREPRVLILDEPTAVLAPQQVDRLLDLLRSFAAGGRTVVLIAHKLDEVLRVADRVTVLREGRTILEAEQSDVDTAALAEAMVGVSVEAVRRTRPSEAGEVVASLQDVVTAGPRGEEALSGITFDVRRGEIVGVAGVDGNGQKELGAVLSGRLPAASGEVLLPSSIGFIPEDRAREALVPGFTLTENVALSDAREGEFRSGPWIRWGEVARRVTHLIERYDVRAAGAKVRAEQLSGGNQQKLVVARELRRAGDLLVAQNPTRGLDVSAEEFVHRRLLDLRADGGPRGKPGIVMISTDLDEVLALSDRVFVLVRGRLLDAGRHPDRDAVGRIMVGGVSG